MDREAGIAAYEARVTAEVYKTRIAGDMSVVHRCRVSGDAPVVRVDLTRVERMTPEVTK